ncbi:hypothetical protein QBC44DRAFT_60385 [Cladorrhinum sp. PSN332]|nr:hypothetical protein QBC44DRAFT_60385 [Cladorrhinum sp. PSN332]
MLSHLRFHRRAPSNPTSPTPDQIAAWEAAAHHDHPESSQDISPRPNARSRSPNPSQPAPPLSPAMASRTDALETSESPALSRTKPPPPPINTGLAGRPVLLAARQAKTTSFVAPTELQQASATASVIRPAGTRLSSEPASLPSSGVAPETHKARKGLPFLKNPVSSLLMRRKSSQAPVDVKPVDTTPSYDPRIRGTRVHDFSAPRRRVVPNPTATQVETPSIETPGARTDPGVSTNSPQGLHADALDYAPASAGQLHDGYGGLRSLSRLSLSDKSVPPVPPKDGAASSVHTLSSKTSRASIKGQSASVDPRASVRSTASRAFSFSSRSVRSSIMSAVPKHMKSTSSRFSFDMIGSAKQEKLLEERHRQREQGKKTPDLASPVHDSRYDDFDEDFDYDAMMDDDGLEEPIPGVNADYDDEEDFDAAMDPDNDQENFAGFVFQRSNPASALASPHTPAVLATPRDANGKVIGFAMTKDITPEVPTPVVADAPALPKLEDAAGGLGIHAAEVEKETTPEDSIYRPSHQPAPVSLQANANNDDDIYFDDGLRDELDFQDDGFVFDESIFDNNDTDQYGRPIPGAFAQAQDAMRAAQLQSKRESDMTSDLSRQSVIPESTTHTSISIGPEQQPILGHEQVAAAPGQIMPMPGQDLAYQAALAEAAQKAAASGKFRRGSSPPPPAELTITSPTDSAADSLTRSQPDTSLDHYEDDYDEDDGGFDSNYDFDFDDEAIIAEANASALANDSDGWYGQEFGFYSAPVPGGNSIRDPNQSALSAENLFSYASGGYFGPAGGLARTTSGRVVSREPNLTPITERSEYSNRNSIMSLTLPPVIGSAEGGGRNSLGSPGLAQLALMGLDDADSTMSLSALMKLRSKAWGGSQASLPSSREGSPRSERAPGGGEAKDLFAGHLHASSISGHARKGSSFSLWSENGDGAVGNGSASPVTANGFFSPSNHSVMPGGVVLSPLPQRPGMGMGMGVGGIGGMFSPGQTVGLPPLLAIPSPLPQNGGMSSGFACSPVLEDEEVENGLAGYEDEDEEDEEDQDYDAEATIMVNGNGSGLAPALPVTTTTTTTTTASALVDGFVDATQRPSMGHKHKGSADSISYTMDEGLEGGGKRWVVERRRTADTGEVEILGREVVEGGRI